MHDQFHTFFGVFCMRPVTPVHWTGLDPGTCGHTATSNAAVALGGPLNFLLKVNITMMSWLVFLCSLTAMVCVSAQGNRYENFNTDAIIQNERILLAYYKCVMDKGPCTKDGKNFKRALPETLSTACGRCTPNQKGVVRSLLLGIRTKSEPRFNELLDKYDPERLNRDSLYKFLITGV